MPQSLRIKLIVVGKTKTSYLQQGIDDFLNMNKGQVHIAFLIGRELGLSEELQQKANLVLSLSAMTFTHDMTRLILLEQIYRAMTILHGEPYHK